jgi:chromosome segregation ATPase
VALNVNGEWFARVWSRKARESGEDLARTQHELIQIRDEKQQVIVARDKMRSELDEIRQERQAAERARDNMKVALELIRAELRNAQARQRYLNDQLNHAQSAKNKALFAKQQAEIDKATAEQDAANARIQAERTRMHYGIPPSLE